MEILKFLLNCICCVAATGLKTKSAYDSICCAPCKCVVEGFVEIKDCYDHCTAQVGVDNDANSVQMAGAAPADVAMA